MMGSRPRDRVAETYHSALIPPNRYVTYVVEYDREVTGLLPHVGYV
jgi:hypothetical protein